LEKNCCRGNHGSWNRSLWDSFEAGFPKSDSTRLAFRIPGVPQGSALGPLLFRFSIRHLWTKCGESWTPPGSSSSEDYLTDNVCRQIVGLINNHETLRCDPAYGHDAVFLKLITLAISSRYHHTSPVPLHQCEPARRNRTKEEKSERRNGNGPDLQHPPLRHVCHNTTSTRVSRYVAMRQMSFRCCGAGFIAAADHKKSINLSQQSQIC
jgi:hypothetical protein